MKVDSRVAALRREIDPAGEKPKRLYRMVEEGVTDLDEILRERLASYKKEREQATAALDRIQVAERPPTVISPEMLERFVRLMRENVTTCETLFRKAWLQAIVDRVEVGADVIRIIGGKADLEAAKIEGRSTAALSVCSSVRKWRARKDSNL